ncbi:MAG: hypothetical protein AAB507_01970 [Patescibacteria group bacterium]
MQMQNGKPNDVQKKTSALGRFSIGATRWIGSTASLITHTILFIGAFVLVYLGIDFDRVLLALTTVVSLEAIYLAIFIQMTINRTTAQLKEVEEDIEEISEDIEEIHENVEDIQEDVEEITVGEEDEEITESAKLEKIEQSLLTIVREIEDLKKGTTVTKF